MSEPASTGDFVWTGGDPPPNDHTLNDCLARVIGRVVETVDKPSTSVDDGGSIELVPGHWYIKRGHSINFDAIEWDPLHDANQMELVEVWLEEQGIEFIIISAHLVHLYFVDLTTAKGKFTAKDRYKKRAFALAVQAMEQSNNNNKED